MELPGRGVNLRIAPERAGWLREWGRDPDGSWWALVLWESEAKRRLAYYPEKIVCAAWVPADTVTPFPGGGYEKIPRHRLGSDPARWPMPPGRFTRRHEGIYYGRLPGDVQDEHLWLPDGWERPDQRLRVRRPRHEQAGPQHRSLG